MSRFQPIRHNSSFNYTAVQKVLSCSRTDDPEANVDIYSIGSLRYWRKHIIDHTGRVQSLRSVPARRDEENISRLEPNKKARDAVHALVHGIVESSLPANFISGGCRATSIRIIDQTLHALPSRWLLINNDSDMQISLIY